MKKVFRTIVLVSSMSSPICALQVANAEAPPDNDINHMSMPEKQQAQAYFRSHSFDFPTIFSAHHPGPFWILKKKIEFKLTEAQLKQEEELKMGMAKNTIQDEAALKKAYETYTIDAAKENPSADQIKTDIEAVGKAQTNLASEMVDYHLKSYAVLTPEQQKIYRDLVNEKTK
ncbi:MAG: hypothetical protein GJU77_04080 [Ferrovum sp.]|nr:hypothetical protein [Ferrovum sp.]NDU89597.1 hypothetical protein [Ferrovum sp.]